MQPTNTLELSELEHQVNQLLYSFECLKQENTALRKEITAYVKERSLLIEKNYHTAQKIRKIIAQLRERIT